MLWQKGLVEREINELLRGLVRDDDERNKSNQNHKTKVKEDTYTFFLNILKVSSLLFKCTTRFKPSLQLFPRVLERKGLS